MARRHPDTSIGERIRIRRQARNWSVRFAADRAGVAHSTWSRIESGQRGADNRFVVADIAQALECSVADLTGQPWLPADAAAAEAQAGAYAVRHALAETDLGEDPLVPAPPVDELRREFDLVQHLRRRCDDLGTAQRLPTLLRQLHASAHTGDRTDALGMLVQAAAMSGGVLRHVATASDQWMAAERARQAAAALNDPVYAGLAEYERALSAIGCGSYPRAYAVASRAVDRLRQHTSMQGAAEVLGMLMLTCAFTALGDRRRDDSATWLSEADELAQRTGDSEAFGLFFGPTNLAIWRIAMEVDGGEPGRAVEIARATTPTRIDTVSRQTSFYSDTGRALSRIRGKDVEALRMLLVAERLAPRRVHGSPLVREATRTLLERSNRVGYRGELVGLAERMAMPV